ncbi:MAG: ferredoxin family protein [Eggerthellaceae bacterium]
MPRSAARAVCARCSAPRAPSRSLDEGGVFGAVHRPSACMQCRLCERICPEQAIAVSGRVHQAVHGQGSRVLRYEAPNLDPEQALIDVR